MAIRIPERYQAGLAALRRLGPDGMDQLTSALAKIDEIPSPRTAAKAIGTQLTELSPTDIHEILSTVFSLYGYRSQSEQSATDLAADLVTAMQRSSVDEFRLPESERRSFEGKLAELLAIPQLERKLKARDLQTEYERTFCTARVITDIRPVFSADPSAAPIDAVIVHSLKIRCHTGGNHEEFFIALDEDDINELSEALDRAKVKGQSLRTFLRSAGVGSS